jgi:hypothetical protein
VVHQNIQQSEIIVAEVLDSDHLPIIFSIVDHVRARDALDPAEKFTDWEHFQSLTSELISPRIQIYSSEEADKAACNFAAPLASAYGLSTRKITILD